MEKEGRREVSSSLKKMIEEKIDSAQAQYNSFLAKSIIESEETGEEEEKLLIRRLCETKKVLKKIAASCRVVVPEQQDEIIKIGSKFKVVSPKTGKKESFIIDGFGFPKDNEKERPQIIDYTTPAGQALLGAKKGGVIRIEARDGSVNYFTIEEIFLPW